MSKNDPKSVQTNFKLVLRKFSRKKLPCAPWNVQTGKNFKKLENFQFSKCPNTFPKVFKLVFNMLREFFQVKKLAQYTLEGKEIEKFQKMEKKISKSRKTFPKVSKFLLRWFFPNFSWPVQPGDQKFEKRIEKIWIPKIIQNVLKSFQTSFELVLRYFSENVLPSAPWRVETWKNTRKMEKLSFFFKMPKNVPQKVQTRFEHALR